MSECVVRMEMPKDCVRCPCGHSDWIWGDDDKEKMVWFCGIDHDSENERHYQLETEFGSRPSYCPILAVLPEKHGRLVDIDRKFLRVATDGRGMSFNWRGSIADILTKDNMQCVEIIVPAERREK